MLELASIWTPSVQQQNYRALLDATARPGKLQKITFNAGDTDAITAILATLLDGEVSLSDPEKRITPDDWPLLQARCAEPEHADFIVCSGATPPCFEPKSGTLASPEQSATLLLQVESLTAGSCHITAQGPGIETTVALFIAGLHESWLEARQAWVSAFPLGVDIFLVAQDSVVALPRTTQLEVI